MYYDDGWRHDGLGPWGWLFMALMMLVLWGGLAWLVVTLIRHGGAHATSAPPTAPPERSAEDILHERLARGDIDVDEYQHRIDALRAKSTRAKRD